MSVFILTGQSLKATAVLQGPVSPSYVTTGLALVNDAEWWEKSHNRNKGKTDIDFEKVLDFEHLYYSPIITSEGDDEGDTPVENTVILPLDPNDPKAAEKRRERGIKERRDLLAAKQTNKILQQKKIREDGEPFLYTATAPSAGWYRVCVQAHWSLVSSRHYISYHYCIDWIDACLLA